MSAMRFCPRCLNTAVIEDGYCGHCQIVTMSAHGTVQYSTATPASHASLIAEVTALRATLNDAVELCETLRADRDKLRTACESVLRGLELSPIAGMETDAAMLRAALGRSAL